MFQQPVLEQDAVAGVFAQMDDLLLGCVQSITASSRDWVERHLSADIVKVAAGSTHGRLIYAKDDGDSQQRFLESGIVLLNVLSWRDSVGVFKPITQRVIREMRYARLVFEDLVGQFLSVTKQYPELLHALSGLHIKLHRKRAQGVQHVVAHSVLERKLLHVERVVSTDRCLLLGAVLDVRARYEQYLRLRDSLIMSYMRIVYREAVERASTHEQALENFQNGISGLISAISRYNINRRVHFSAYAKLWVRQAILFWIKESSSVIKLPAIVWQAHNKIDEIRTRRLAQTGSDRIEDDPTMSRRVIKKIRSVEDSIRLGQVFSLQHQVNQEDGTTLEGCVGDDTALQQIDDAITANAISRHAADLSPRQRRVLALSFGLLHLLQDSGPISAEDIRAERIRQDTTRLNICVV